MRRRGLTHTIRMGGRIGSRSFCRTDVIPSAARNLHRPDRALSIGTLRIPRLSARDDNPLGVSDSTQSRAMSTVSSRLITIAIAVATLGTARVAAGQASIDR